MKRILFIFALTALVLTACGAAATPAPSITSYAGAPAPQSDLAPKEAPAANQPMAMATAANFDTSKTAVDTGNPGAQERVVIQNADLTIVVKDPKAKLNEIGALANNLGGFVVSSNQYETSTRNGSTVPEASITIRVPAKSLDDALTQIKTGVVDIQAETRTGQDVTDQYVDLQSRLKARQAAADQLTKMMEQAQTATDTLDIFNRLTEVQTEIEQLKGQINYYDQAAALSAISVRLLAEESIQPIQIAGWQPQGVARDAVQALVNFFQGFASFLIWLIIFILPVAAVIIVLLALLWRLFRWFWRKLFPKKTPPAAEPAKSTDLVK